MAEAAAVSGVVGVEASGYELSSIKRVVVRISGSGAARSIMSVGCFDADTAGVPG